MAFVVKDRVKETSTTQGTSTFTLDGAVTGFQSFAAIGDGNTTYYTITAGAEWEVGIGIYTASGTTLSRNTVLSSSNNGNLVNFSAGSKDVFVVYPSERAVVVNGSTVEVPNLAVLPVSGGGTGSNTASFSGANISGLNASNVSTGVLALANGGTGSSTASFSGANITSLNASNVTSGILPLDHGGTGSATATFSGANITSINANNISSGVLAVAHGGTGSADATFSGANITSLNASNISTGTIANARTTASSSNGANTIVARGASGEFSAGAVTTISVSGDGSGLTSLNASSISSGTLDNARTTASASNGASTIVARGLNGEFAAAAITGTSFTGDGSALTSLNASNLTTGTVGTARLASGTANNTTFLRGDQTWAAPSGIPAGGIIMWSGSIASIPSGWVLCNGLNSTPDLRNRFIVGAFQDNAGVAVTTITGSNTSTGGAATITLAETNLPSHTHTFSATTGNASVGHTHTFSVTSGNQSADHTHTYSGNTGNQSVDHTHTFNVNVNTGANSVDHTHTYSGNTGAGGDHRHNFLIPNAGYGLNIGSAVVSATGTATASAGYTVAGTNLVTASGNHTHPFSGTTSGISANHTHNVNVAGTTSGMSVSHTHAFSGTTSGMSVNHTHAVSGTTADQSVTHTHAVSGTTGATGSGTAFSNLPTYYALAYIMKT